MKILIISDAWKPQINGVVRALEYMENELRQMGHDVRIVGPDNARPYVFALPFYRMIELEFFASSRLSKIYEDFMPDAVHIATEGPLGWTARHICLRRKMPFSTSYHTRFPDYISKHAPRFLASAVACAVTRILRRFHAESAAVMVSTPSMERELRAEGYKRLVLCPQGVDCSLFRPRGKSFPAYKDLPRPILLNVGRIAAEKNLREFLDLKIPGTKVLIGDGPDLARLSREYPDAHFMGALEGENLARAYAAADLFVFPSKTDTFGLVLLEACASGLRIAAHPVAGPADIFADPESKTFAVLDADLQAAVTQALALSDDPQTPSAYASKFSWNASARQFLASLATKGEGGVYKL
ncbi:MAG: glycosyltransferase family 1 protein [Alphaproteobacteria bacterium]|nr:glycosyltransferase family 1 protein [Alphaproteobacteria bacterium]